MLTIFVLFVGLTLATAVIAYWSDNLGKKLGKKRVSLWGLRPRTSATMLTIASSWGIMVFTLAVMLSLFPPLRQALLRFDEVKAQEKSLRASKNQLDTKVKDLNGQLTALTGQAADASKQLSDVRLQLKQARTAATEARRTRQAAQQEAKRARDNAKQAVERETKATAREAAARKNLETVSAQRDATQQQRDAAKGELNAAQAELQSARAQVQSAQTQVAAANTRVADANAKARQADELYRKANQNLTQVQRNLRQAQGATLEAQDNEKISQANAKAAEQRAQVAGQRATIAGQQALAAGQQFVAAETQRVQAETQVREAQTKVDDLEAQAKRLTEANDILAADNVRVVRERDAIFLNDVRVPVGQTLASRSFEQTPSVSEARDELHALFERAAKTVMPTVLPGAHLELVPLLVGDANNPTELSSDDIYAQLASVIARNQNALSVRLVAARNHRLGDKVLDARFTIVPIRPALATDTELASAVLDGRSSDASLFSALLRLVDAGRQSASESGVSPPLSPEAPDFYAPGANEQLFKTLRALSALDGPARVRILALQPISTVDQLRVRFEIEPLAPATTTTANASVAPRAQNQAVPTSVPVAVPTS